jgi:hypothetical protein
MTPFTADFEQGGLVAVGAAERVFEKDRQGDPQAVAAQEGAGMAVFGAAFFGENRGHAERAAGACGHDPLQNGEEGGQQNQSHGDQGQFLIVDGEGVAQQAGGDRGHQAFEANQEGCDPQAVNGCFGVKAVHGGDDGDNGRRGPESIGEVLEERSKPPQKPEARKSITSAEMVLF